MTPPSGKKLLVADDSLTIQKVIRLALSSEGYDIQAVSDGNEALQQIAVFRPDVILIDVSLPGQSAFEVKSAFNANPDPGHARFILMSSAFEQIDESQASAVGFDGRLTKPFDPAHLRQVIQDVLGANVPPPAPAEAEGTDSGLWGNNLQSLHTELPTPRNADDDIRNLTESTIRLSGLDDFNWSVKEPSRKSPPAVTREREATLPAFTPRKNMDNFSDLGGSNFQIEPPQVSHQLNEGNDLGLPILDPEELHDAAHEDSGIMPALTPPPPPLHAYGSSAGYGEMSGISGVGSHNLGGPDVMPLTTGQVEAMIQKQLQETLEAMAKKLLPEIAERLLKQEIHRMLEQQS